MFVALLFSAVKQLGIKWLGDAGAVVVTLWQQECNGTVPFAGLKGDLDLGHGFLGAPYHDRALARPFLNQSVVHQKLQRLAHRCPVYLVGFPDFTL